MRFVSVMLGLLMAQALFAQDPVFTQLYSTPLYLNPSFAGSAGCSRVQLNYRNQWPAVSGSFNTYYFSYDQYVHPIRGGVGFVSMYDNVGNGMIRTYSNSLIYSFKWVVEDKLVISPSVMIGHRYKVLDWDKMTFGDFTDPRYSSFYSGNEIPQQQALSSPDFGAGVLVNTRKLTAGIAVDHITQPNESFSGPGKLPRKYSVHLAYDFQKQEDSRFSFSPSFIFQKQQDFNLLHFYASFRYKWLHWALGYSNEDAAIFGLGFQTKKIRLRYSYDITISRLSNATLGSNEIALRFLFNCKNKEEKIIPVASIAF